MKSAMEILGIEKRIQDSRARKATGVASLILRKVIAQAEIVMDGLSDIEWYGMCVEAGYPSLDEKPPSAESRAMVKELVKGAKIV